VARGERTDHDRRASGHLRRYAVTNRADRLATLTCRDQTHDLATVQARTAWFLRRLRQRHPRLAYVRVFERHASGALHVHVLVNGYVPKPELQALWPHGWVDVRRLRSRRAGTRPGREHARLAARYIAKYVTKDPVRTAGGHRYEVRQGLQPESRVEWVDGLDTRAILEMVADSLGVTPGYAWHSGTVADWTGPPTAFMSW